MVHKSGLFVYFETDPTQLGRILCVGPFSSYRQKLCKEEVQKYTASAIAQLESQSPFSGSFTVWGIYTTNASTGLTIHLMDREFGFSPNLSFRSTMLVKENAPDTAIAKEWIFTKDKPKLEHRSGVCFTFHADNESENTILGTVERTGEAKEIYAIDSSLRRIQIEALATTALSILSVYNSNSLQNITLGHRPLHLVGKLF